MSEGLDTAHARNRHTVQIIGTKRQSNVATEFVFMLFATPSAWCCRTAPKRFRKLSGMDEYTETNMNKTTNWNIVYP